MSKVCCYVAAYFVDNFKIRMFGLKLTTTPLHRAKVLLKSIFVRRPQRSEDRGRKNENILPYLLSGAIVSRTRDSETINPFML